MTETDKIENSTAPASLVKRLVIRYADDAPGVRASENNICCCNCKHIYQDTEIDECKKHPGMYHDWDMPDSENFAYSLVCNDFCV